MPSPGAILWQVFWQDMRNANAGMYNVTTFNSSMAQRLQNVTDGITMYDSL
jgi:hypothetical protein